MAKVMIEVTEPEHFAFTFIGNNDGKGIPVPIPKTVLSLERKGLVVRGNSLACDKVKFFLTKLGKMCFKPQERSSEN